MKHKILYLLSDSDFTGASRHLFDLITHLDKKRFTPILISKPSPIINKLKNSIKVYPVAMKSRLDFDSIKQIKNIILQEKPQLVHLHSTRAGILGTLAAKQMGIPIIYTEHLFTHQYQPHNRLIHFLQIHTYRSLSPFITQVIAVSEAVKKYLISARIFPSDKIKVIYHGVDRAKNQKLKTKSYNDKIVLGTIGSLNKLKGHEYLIKALNIVKDYAEIGKLEIIGKGSQEKKLKSLAKKYQLLGKIKFIPSVKGVREKMIGWDIYIQSSASESFGLAIAEAMSVGLALVATKTGGISELVGDCGLLVPARNPQALASAIIKLAQNKKLRSSLGQKAQKRINNNFSLDKTIQETEKLYEKIIKKSS